jgi:hypothetical protein
VVSLSLATGKAFFLPTVGFEGIKRRGKKMHLHISYCKQLHVKGYMAFENLRKGGKKTLL